MITYADERPSMALLAPPVETEWPRLALLHKWSGLNDPSCLAHAGDGRGRLFVGERRGRVLEIERGRVAEEPFLDVSSRVRCRGPREGLLDVCFRSLPGLRPLSVFVAYTAPGRLVRVSEFALEQGSPSEERVLLELPAGRTAALTHGADDRLYLALGPHAIAREGGVLVYDVFAATSGLDEARWEVRLPGAASPSGLTLDRLTGEVYVADHGETGERVLYSPAVSSDDGLSPVASYPHAEGAGIVRGAVYRGRRHPSLHGMFLSADETTGEIRGVRRGPSGEWESRRLAKTQTCPTGLWEDERGEVYLATRDGDVFEVGAAETSTF